MAVGGTGQDWKQSRHIRNPGTGDQCSWAWLSQGCVAVFGGGTLVKHCSPGDCSSAPGAGGWCTRCLFSWEGGALDAPPPAPSAPLHRWRRSASGWVGSWTVYKLEV